MNKLLLLTLLLFAKTTFSQYLTIKPINCNISESEHKKIEKLLNYERMFFNEIFATEINIDVPITINIFGKAKDFKALKLQSHAPKSADGFYSSVLNQAFLYKNSDFISICLHEASHCLMESNFKRPPRWLNEGLAEFFETFDIDNNGDLYSSPQEGRLNSIKSGIALKDSTRLKTFFKLNGSDFYTEGITDNYSTAYSIIYFFIKSRNSEALKNIIRLIKIGITSENAIIKTFGNFKDFEEGYNRFYYFYKGKKY